MLLSAMYLQTTNHRTAVTPHDVTVRHVPTNNKSQNCCYTPRCYCPPCTYKQPITELLLHPTMLLSAMYLQTTNHRTPVTSHDVTVRHVPTNNQSQTSSYIPRCYCPPCTYKQPITDLQLHPTMLLSAMYLQTTNHRPPVTSHHVPTNNQSQTSSYTPRCYCPPCTYKQPITDLQLHPTMLLSAMYLQTTNQRTQVTPHDVTVRHIPTVTYIRMVSNQSQSLMSHNQSELYLNKSQTPQDTFSNSNHRQFILGHKFTC